MDPLPWMHIRQKRIDLWDEDNLSLSLFTYRPRRSQQADEVTELILGFKVHDAKCFEAAVSEACDVLKKHEADWKRECDCRYIVPVPSHVARQVSPPSRGMCRVIAEIFKLKYPEELLFRKDTVEPAHLATPWERRLSSTEHFQSLSCQRADLAGPA